MAEKMSEKNPWMVSTLLLVGFVVGYGASNVASYFDDGGGTAGQAAVVAQPSAPAPSPSEPAPVVLDEDAIAALPDDDAVLGDEDAPITIVEFSDYQCPFCQRFWSQTLPELKSTYIDTGKVKLVYRDYPLYIHPNAEPAAQAAQCAGDQGKYWEYHDVLFGKLDSWGPLPDPKEAFTGFAGELGLDEGDFTACLESEKYKDEVAADLSAGSAVGVQGTPSFFVNGKQISGAQPFASFQAVIEAELGE